MIYLVFFTDNGAPKTGLFPTIITYKKVSDNADVSSPPAISEVGGGVYKFTDIPSEALAVVIDGTSTLADLDRYKVMQITPNDGNLDAAVSTRAPEAGGNLAAVKAKTDNLPVNPADEANVETHVAAALNAYHPQTQEEATADKDAVLAALASAGITVGDILSGNIADDQDFPAHSLADLIRRLFWTICNRMVINDTTGAFTAYKSDGVTPGITGTISDDGSNTARNIT